MAPRFRAALLVGRQLTAEFEARDAQARLIAEYGNVAAEDADTIVALGGDGLMLQTLHQLDHTLGACGGQHVVERGETRAHRPWSEKGSARPIMGLKIGVVWC